MGLVATDPQKKQSFSRYQPKVGEDLVFCFPRYPEHQGLFLEKRGVGSEMGFTFTKHLLLSARCFILH